MAGKTTTLNIRLEPEVKEQAEAVFKQLGISSSIAVNMFFRQVIMRRGMPFELKEHYPHVPDISDMTEEEFLAKINKARESIRAGKGIPAEEVYENMRRKYGVTL